MLASIYKKIVIDFTKITLLAISILIIFSLYQAKNFNLDASSDALLLEGDPDLKYLREVNETYGSKDFLVLTYTPVSDFTDKETILNLQLLKSKIEKLTWVDSVITIIDVPLLKASLSNSVLGKTTDATSAIATLRMYEDLFALQNTASSKSLASSPSMVTKGI